MKIRRFIVSGLESACGLTHRAPLKWLQMRCHLANLSDRLDQRWGTDVWRGDGSVR